jgi:outer membrane lipoprotein-sorting protein
LSQDVVVTVRSMTILQRTVLVVQTAGLLVLLLLSACISPHRIELTDEDTAEIDRVVAYLNSIPRFEANFSQSGSFGPDGGLIWLDRPAGRLRIDSTSRSGRVMVIADGQVLIVDRHEGSTTTMPVSHTPLGMLLTPDISLSGAVTVVGLEHQDGTTQVTLEKTGEPSQGTLALTLTDQPLRLIAVTITDTYHRTLTMNLSGIDTKPVLAPDLFHAPAVSVGD